MSEPESALTAANTNNHPSPPNPHGLTDQHSTELIWKSVREPNIKKGVSPR